MDKSEMISTMMYTLIATRHHNGPIYSRAQAMIEELEKRGLVLAKIQTVEDQIKKAIGHPGGPL